MKPDSRFERLEQDVVLVPVRFDGQDYALPEGANLAAALMAEGVDVFRKTRRHREWRGPYCLMGVCFECIVKIGDETRQACLEEVQAGMEIMRHDELQDGHNGAR